MWAGLDLSSQSEGVGLFHKACFYYQREDTQARFSDIARDTRNNADRVAVTFGFFDKRQSRFADGVNEEIGKNWRNFVPGQFALDSEAVSLAGGTGLSFMTTHDARRFVDTPLDTIDKIDFGNLGKQLSMVACLVDHWFRDSKDDAQRWVRCLPVH